MSPSYNEQPVRWKRVRNRIALILALPFIIVIVTILNAGEAAYDLGEGFWYGEGLVAMSHDAQGAVICLELVSDDSPEFARVQRVLRDAGFLLDIVYMPVPRCDQCKYWHPVNDASEGDCVKIHDDMQQPDSAKAFLNTDDCAGLVTKPDFGCVLFVEKPV